jgi:hypothetical protein
VFFDNRITKRLFTDFTDFTDLKYQKNIPEQVNHGGMLWSVKSVKKPVWKLGYEAVSEVSDFKNNRARGVVFDNRITKRLFHCATRSLGLKDVW